MDRREAMKKVAVILGGSLSISTIAVFQQGCQTRADRTPGVFSDWDADVLNAIGDVIIPPTDTPGAAAVDTGGFTVKMLEDCYPENARTKVTTFLSETLSDFDQLSVDAQARKISEIDAMAYGENSNKEYEGYKMIKELTLFGYFTSEAGMTQALEYVEIPGRYEGCIDLEPGQKAWA